MSPSLMNLNSLLLRLYVDFAHLVQWKRTRMKILAHNS